MLYTTHKTELGKLRAYRAELDERYRERIRRHNFVGARAIADLRRRVHRAILLCEEWHVDSLDLVPTA